ncbi:hypothetical protein CJU90_6192 [Yarrowia sp. C11]|nr:hypothetical protein CJU90_6192 [Yarrowia sp. C11]KAG5370900.1 hypothetical protein CKK34_1032 [Yarrowia sp. E02]
MTTIERPCDYYPFCHQFEQVDRAIETLVKSGQLYQHTNNSYGRYGQPNQHKYRKSPPQYYYDKQQVHQQHQQPQQPQQQHQAHQAHQQYRKNYYYSPQLNSQTTSHTHNIPQVSLASAQPQSIQIPAHAPPQSYRSQSYSSFQTHSRLGSVGSVGSMPSPALVATSAMTPVLQPTAGPFTKTQRPRTGDRDVTDFDEVDSAIKGLGDMSLELDEGDDKDEFADEFGSKSFDKKAFEPSVTSATSSPISFTFDPFAGLGIGKSESASAAADDKETSPPSVFAPIGTKPDALASSQRPWPKKSALGMSTTTVWG